MSYANTYIMQALNSDKLDVPDEQQANGSFDTLYALYTAHAAAGPTGARQAWAVLKKFKPELVANLEHQRRLIHADELKNLSQPTYALADYAIYEGSFNVIVGPSGSRKSFIALDIAGRIAVNHPVVYIAGEGLNGYAARWEAWKHHHQVAHTELYFYSEALQVMEVNQLIEFMTIIQQHRPVLVIVDTLARSAVGIEENSAREMGLFTDNIDRLRRSMNCAVLIVHHTGINGKIRGSTALYGAADSVLAVCTEDDITSVYNDPEHGGKNKYAASMPVKYFSLLPVSINGFEGAVIIPAEKIQRTNEDTLPDNAVQILEALEGIPAMKGPAIIAATGISKQTVYRNMKRLIQVGYVDQGDDGETYSITSKGENYLFNRED